MATLTRWDPWTDMLDLQRSINRLFFDTMGRGDVRGEGFAQAWAFPVDIYETADELVVRADLPGIAMEDIAVQVTGNELVIKGERKNPYADSDVTWMRNESRFGSFYRTFHLGTQIDADAIRASFDDGVLTVHLPKADAVKPKLIPIQSPRLTQ